MPRKVLIPVNDQESAIVAIECAMARKWPPDTTFLLCSIIEDLANVPAGCSLAHKEVLVAEQAAHAKEMTDWLTQASQLFSTVFPQADSVIECGQIPAKICEIAAQWGADYILIGSHSFGLPNRLALRGVAAQVLAFAPCTVEAVRFRSVREMLVHNNSLDLDKIRAIASQAPRKVLIASDLSTQSTFAADWVAEQDWGEDCHVRLISVFINSKTDSGIAIHEKAHLYTEEKKYQKHLENELRVLGRRILAKQPGLKIDSYLVQSHSALQGILYEVEAWGANLVVTGAQGSGRSDESRAGSNAVKLMDNLECSMLAVREPKNESVHYTWYQELQDPKIEP